MTAYDGGEMARRMLTNDSTKYVMMNAIELPLGFEPSSLKE